MSAEYILGGIYIDAAPVHGLIALLIALVLHRLLIAVRFYRFVWHPVLFDTAMFILVWALVTLWLPPLVPSLLHGQIP